MLEPLFFASIIGPEFTTLIYTDALLSQKSYCFQVEFSIVFME